MPRECFHDWTLTHYSLAHFLLQIEEKFEFLLLFEISVLCCLFGLKMVFFSDSFIWRQQKVNVRRGSLRQWWRRERKSLTSLHTIFYSYHTLLSCSPLCFITLKRNSNLSLTSFFFTITNLVEHLSFSVLLFYVF